MSNPQNDIKSIQAYIANKLSQADREHFERRLMTDPFFADAFDGYQSLPSALNGNKGLHKNNPFKAQWGGVVITSLVGLILVVIAWSFPSIEYGNASLINEEEGSDQTIIVNQVSKAESVKNSNQEIKVSNHTIEYSSINDEEGVLDIQIMGEVELDNETVGVYDDMLVEGIPTSESFGASNEKIKVPKMNMSPYLAFTNNQFKFMLIQPMGNLSNGEKKKLEKKRKRLENQIEVGLSVIEGLKNNELERIPSLLDDYRNDKLHDPEMYAWMKCLYLAKKERWKESVSLSDSLRNSPTQVGLQCTKLSLEIKKRLLLPE